MELRSLINTKVLHEAFAVFKEIGSVDFYLYNVRGKMELSEAARPEGLLFSRLVLQEGLACPAGVTDRLVVLDYLTGLHTQHNVDEGALLNREFSFGVSDCMSIVRDYYQQEIGVTMLLDLDGVEWLTIPNRDGYLNLETDKHLAVNKFVPVVTLEKNDLILVSTIGNDIVDHLMVCVGGNNVLHHFRNRLSCVEPYEGFLKNKTLGYYRYNG